MRFKRDLESPDLKDLKGSSSGGFTEFSNLLILEMLLFSKSLLSKINNIFYLSTGKF